MPQWFKRAAERIAYAVSAAAVRFVEWPQLALVGAVGVSLLVGGFGSAPWKHAGWWPSAVSWSIAFAISALVVIAHFAKRHAGFGARLREDRERRSGLASIARVLGDHEWLLAELESPRAGGFTEVQLHAANGVLYAHTRFVVGRYLGKSALHLLDSPAGLQLGRTPPETMPDALLAKWREVAWRTERLGDFVTRL